MNTSVLIPLKSGLGWFARERETMAACTVLIPLKSGLGWFAMITEEMK